MSAGLKAGWARGGGGRAAARAQRTRAQLCLEPESRGPREKQRGRLQAPHSGSRNLSKPRVDGAGAGVAAGTQERRGAGSQGCRARRPPQTPGTCTRTCPWSSPLTGRGQAQTGSDTPPPTHTHRMASCTRSGTRAVTYNPASGSFPASSVGILQTAESQRQDRTGGPCPSSTVPLGWRPRERRAGEGLGHTPHWPGHATCPRGPGPSRWQAGDLPPPVCSGLQPEVPAEGAGSGNKNSEESHLYSTGRLSHYYYNIL